MSFQSLCVFCGSSFGKRPAYREAARAMGEALAARQIDLVWGGGHVGLMGVIADATLAAGGRAIGVIPHFMAEKELAHPTATEIIEVATMHERKAAMAARAEGFIALPGGFGTYDELFEILTWAQLGLHRKPMGLLNVEGYFDPLLALLQQALDEGFARPSHATLLCVATEPAALIERMQNHILPESDWANASHLARP